MDNEKAMRDSAFYDVRLFVIKFEVIYAQVHTCVLDVDFLISQEPANVILAGFFCSKDMILPHIPSICSRILGKIWVWNVKITVER